MTLLWADAALLRLQALQQAELADGAYDRLVRRLVHLENDASTFEAVYGVVDLPAATGTAGAGPLRAHIVEADPGWVFVILYRLALDAEDVWIVGLDHGQ